MAKFADEIEEEAGGPILACVIGGASQEGRICDYRGPEREPRDIDPAKCGIVLPWSEARALLDYEWDSGFGGADCHPVMAWTADRVVYVAEYDGSTRVSWMPRNPTALDPSFA